MSAVTVARAQGLFPLVGGGRPLPHLRSFEWVFGPKTPVTGPAPESLGQARRAGVGSAVTLPAVGLVHVPLGRIRPTYLLDAAMQAGRPAVWWRCGKPWAGVRSAPRPR
ncbi:hypothetical protein ACWDE9_34510 [Streptomyces olivaceoviridis]